MDWNMGIVVWREKGSRLEGKIRCSCHRMDNHGRGRSYPWNIKKKYYNYYLPIEIISIFGLHVCEWCLLTVVDK